MMSLTACEDYLDKQMVTSINEDITFASYEKDKSIRTCHRCQYGLRF